MFINTLRTGQIAGRKLSHIMPFEAFTNMTDDDLKDIFAYIKTRPPVKHRVSNGSADDVCPLQQDTRAGGAEQKGGTVDYRCSFGLVCASWVSELRTAQSSSK